MDAQLKARILSILDKNRTMTIATLRPDGWPQATKVGYGSKELTLYFLCAPESQKAANLALDDRVSLTVDDDCAQVMEITGLSMAAHATLVEDRDEAVAAMALLVAKYPEQALLPGPMPGPEDARIFRVVPTVISVLDYSKGFGHTDLVNC
ncbi:MAG: pyridoxamine 5'-phosphate oxidase family protein [Pseudomonadota bacterium]